MGVAGLKQLWDAIKPPPAVGHSPEEEAPPPEDWTRRKRLLKITALVIVVGVSAWGGYVYIASAPKRAEALVADGMRLVAAGKYSDAEARFTKATNIWPEMAAGYFERGLVRQNLNEPDAASKDFEQALSLDQNLPEAHAALGTIDRQRGDIKGALNEFTQAINLGSKVDAAYQRGQVYESMGDHKKAIDDYDAAIAQDPDAPFVYLARALARKAVGDQEGSAADQQKADAIIHPEGVKAAQ